VYLLVIKITLVRGDYTSTNRFPVSPSGFRVEMVEMLEIFEIVEPQKYPPRRRSGHV